MTSAIVELVTDQLRFPVLVFGTDNIVSVGESEISITVCTSLALENGWFKDQLIVESNGKAYHITGARRLHGHGPLWGYGTILFTRMLRVTLLWQGEMTHLTVDEVRRLIQLSFQKSRGWHARPDFSAMKVNVAQSRTIAELIDTLREPNDYRGEKR